jgi:hypothetical protein
MNLNFMHLFIEQYLVKCEIYAEPDAYKSTWAQTTTSCTTNDDYPRLIKIQSSKA